MEMVKVRESEVRGIVEQFRALPDPRSTTNRRHLLVDVLVLSVLAVIAGADGPVAIALWGQLNHDWLKRRLKLPRGIPSHDTIGRVLESLKPASFQQCFSAWLESLLVGGEEDSGRPQVAIDGKALRRSHDRGRGLGPLHLVSAWATDRGITLGQVATEEKSNEITAIPELLKQINVQGAIVTIDAAGCQKNIANDIVEGGGDYLLALKGNQGNLHQAVEDFVADHTVDDFARVQASRYEEEETSHGRKEHRFYCQMNAPDHLPGRAAWRNLKTIGVAFRISEVNGKEQMEMRYYISSLKRNVKVFARAVRNHWRIENTLHWSLDMTFREDESRIRGRRVAENIGWLRRITLSLLKQHPLKQSLVMKRRMAGWSRDFLMELLTGKTT
jgi:predicted transposase YbfD/YdcC